MARSRWSPAHVTVKGTDGRRSGQDVSGEVVLPQARGGADHRGRASAARSRRTSTSSCRPSRCRTRRRASRCTSTRWSTGSGRASACWRSAPAIALLPETGVQLRAGAVPAEAATASLLLLALLLCAGGWRRGAARRATRRRASCSRRSKDGQEVTTQAGLLVRRLREAAGGRVRLRPLRADASREVDAAHARRKADDEVVVAALRGAGRRQARCSREPSTRVRPAGVAAARTSLGGSAGLLLAPACSRCAGRTPRTRRPGRDARGRRRPALAPRRRTARPRRSRLPRPR